ncbi:hypothetical protein C0J52_00410 [Blattella germanica]|nr:hypothetical protein C0J52_00410 [Blattella germanica]
MIDVRSRKNSAPVLKQTWSDEPGLVDNGNSLFWYSRNFVKVSQGLCPSGIIQHMRDKCNWLLRLGWDFPGKVTLNFLFGISTPHPTLNQQHQVANVLNMEKLTP